MHARDAALVRQELDGCALVFAGHTRTTDVERLVAVGWVRDIAAARRASPRVVLSATRRVSPAAPACPRRPSRAARGARATDLCWCRSRAPGTPRSLVCADCRRPARCAHCAGPLHAPRARAVPECGWCGRTATGLDVPALLVRRACGMASSGSERTADELGRAFPGMRVIVADGDHPVMRVDARPALVVATRGAEPIADGGYRAVILLDGERMLLAEDLRIGESCLRWWSNAAALAAPGAPVHLVGVPAPSPGHSRPGRPAAYARAELAERAPLRMPPAVRVAALEGDALAVDGALWPSCARRCPSSTTTAVLGPVATGRRRARAPSCASTTRAATQVDREPARVGGRRGAPGPQPAEGSAPRRRAIHSECGSTCSISTCEERHAPRLRRDAGSGRPVTPRARGIRPRHRRPSSPAPTPRSAANGCSRPRPWPGGRASSGFTIIKRRRLDAAATAGSRRCEPDLGVIVAYGGLVREPLLSAPAHGWINLHFSLLPRWRGRRTRAACADRGRRETGASVFQLVARARRRRRVRRAATPLARRDRGRRAR